MAREPIHHPHVPGDDWHVPRAKMELAAVLGPKTTILGDGVPSSPRMGTLINEYNKLLLRRVALWLGVGL